jgi:hypothetical protein
MDIAILVNLHARRGSEAVAHACRARIPGARVLASRSLDEARAFARTLRDEPPDLVVSAGGDGSAVSLLNALRADNPRALVGEIEDPVLGVLPLGTGNGWAHATGAPRWRRAVHELGRLAVAGRPVPRRRFELLAIDGTVAPFAGTGLDAEILEDFHAQRAGQGLLPRLLPDKTRAGLAGYFFGIATRTIPRHVRTDAVEVELYNLGDDALTVDEGGQLQPVAGGGHGALLYRGPMSVCAAGTTPEWGFGFRAFPFAGLAPRRFCVRIYAGGVVDALLNASSLWRGTHPLAKMHSFLLTRCRAVFSRPVPFQIGGDRTGWRTEVEYGLATDPVDLLDWRALPV